MVLAWCTAHDYWGLNSSPSGIATTCFPLTLSNRHANDPKTRLCCHCGKPKETAYHSPHDCHISQAIITKLQNHHSSGNIPSKRSGVRKVVPFCPTSKPSSEHVNEIETGNNALLRYLVQNTQKFQGLLSERMGMCGPARRKQPRKSA